MTDSELVEMGKTSGASHLRLQSALELYFEGSSLNLELPCIFPQLLVM